MSGGQLGVAGLYLRHPAWQTLAAWRGSEPVWSARPWGHEQDWSWAGPEVVTAAAAEELDELLTKLESEAVRTPVGQSAARVPRSGRRASGVPA